MNITTLPPAKSCKAQIRDILINAGGWIDMHQMMTKIVGVKASAVRTEVSILWHAKLIEKDCEGPGYVARFCANELTPTIKDRPTRKPPKPQEPKLPSATDQICALLLKHGKPMTKAQLLPLIQRQKKMGISSYLTTLHHAGWIGYTPQAVGNSGTFWANERTASYASRGAQPRAKREVLQDAEPEPPSFKPMYASAIALPRGMPSFTPLPRQTWEPPRGFDPVIQSRGF